MVEYTYDETKKKNLPIKVAQSARMRVGTHPMKGIHNVDLLEHAQSVEAAAN